MIQICAWCRAWMGQTNPLEDRRVTHAICPTCLAHQLTELAASQNGSVTETHPSLCEAQRSEVVLS